MPSFLSRQSAPDLAYHVSPPRQSSLPFVMFCGGYASDMQGTKATFLQEQCRTRGQGYVRFDYSGHGQSGGDFLEGTIGVWCNDALAILDDIVEAPALVIGSSMGGWIALLMALARPEKIKGIIGIAAAPDFTGWIEADLTDTQKKQMEETGYAEQAHEYSDEPYRFTRALIEEGKTHYLMTGAPIGFDGPVRLLQGMKDDSVPWQTAHRIKNALISADCAVYLIEEGDHSLSRPEDLDLLNQCIVDLNGRI